MAQRRSKHTPNKTCYINRKSNCRYQRRKMACVFHLYLLPLMMTLCVGQKNGKPITCHAGTFAPGEPASVTCNFHAVNATGAGVNLVRYPPGASEYHAGNDVLLCVWKENERKHHCQVAKDYDFDGNITETLTVHIASVSEKDAGLYMCFLQPADGTDSHACELFVTVNLPKPNDELHATTPTINNSEKQSDGDIYTVTTISMSIIAVTLLAMFATMGVYMYRKSQRKPSAKTDVHLESIQLLTTTEPTGDISRKSVHIEPRGSYPQEGVEELIKRFRLTDKDLQTIMTRMEEKLKAGRASKADTTMFSTVLKRLPNGTEEGEVLVVNLSSRWLRVLLMNMQLGQPEPECEAMTYDIPTTIRMGRCAQLFDFIAGRVKMFLHSLGRSEDNLSLAFVFCFPCAYEKNGDLTRALAVRPNKGFCCHDIANKNVGRLLEQALKKKGCSQDLKAIINDAVGILLSGVRKDSSCKVSFIVGHGVNGCFMQKEISEQDQSKNECDTGKVIINTECGSLGEDGRLNEYRTEFDCELDDFSSNPKQQILEKMVSRLYIGDIVRLVLLKLIQKELLFKAFHSELAAFNDRGGFTTEHALVIESDTSNGHTTTRKVLQGLKVEQCSDDDCKIVKYVCEIVVERAAYLAAAALSALITHVKEEHVVVAIEGFLFESHPRFRALMEAKAKELVGSRCEVSFIQTVDGSNKGAALIVAASLPTSQTASQQQSPPQSADQ